MTTRAPEAVGVRFYLYGCRHVPLEVAAQRVARALTVVFQHRTSWLRGAYYRWSSDDGADILVQANVADEDGLLVEMGHAEYPTLVYATGLDETGYDALARVEGLRLLDADIVLVG